MLKFAAADVLSAELAPGRGLNAASVTVKTAHRAVFQYEKRPGFLYVRSRAISSRCNDNFDEFPAEEIKKAYRTFIGKPVFVNHHNDDPRRARGVIIDAVLHEDVLPDGAPDTWAEVLMEVDAVRFPKLAKAILAGEVDRTSMGTDVAFSKCSVCNNKATTPLEYCQHIPKMKGSRVYRTTASGKKEGILVREICYGLGFFENSLLVEEPADPTAFFLGVEAGPGVKTATRKQATDWDQFDSNYGYRSGHQHGAQGEYEEHGRIEEKMRAGHPLDGHEIDYMVGHQHGVERAREIAAGQHALQQIWQDHGQAYSSKTATQTRCGDCGGLEGYPGEHTQEPDKHGKTFWHDDQAFMSPRGLTNVPESITHETEHPQWRGMDHTRFTFTQGDGQDRSHPAVFELFEDRFRPLKPSLNSFQGFMAAQGIDVTAAYEPEKCDHCGLSHPTGYHQAHVEFVERQNQMQVMRDAGYCDCAGSRKIEPHRQEDHSEWARRNHDAGRTDPWGHPYHQPYDGHGAWNCNNRNCAEHPQHLYEQGPGPVGMPGWMKHQNDPNRDLVREVGKAFHEQGLSEDAHWLLDQQRQGPSKYSSKTAGEWSGPKQPLVMGHEVDWDKPWETDGPYRARCSCGQDFPARDDHNQAFIDALSHGSRGNPAFDEDDITARERLLHNPVPSTKKGSLSDEERAWYQSLHDAGEMVRQMHEHGQKRPVNLADHHDVKAHLMEAHGYDESDFWRNSHEANHPALGDFSYDDRPFAHGEYRSLHDWEHGAHPHVPNTHPDYDGGLPGHFLGDSHFHTAARTAGRKWPKVSEMDEKTRAEFEAWKADGQRWNKRNPVHPDNIIAHWNIATPHERHTGMNWYRDAHELTKHIANDTGHDMHTAAGLMSNYSPQQHWASNMLNAARAMRQKSGIGGPGSGVYATSHQREVADKLMGANGHDKHTYHQVLSGPKTHAFAHLIEHGGNADPSDPKVVIDRHALSVAAGRRARDVDYVTSGLGTKRRYKEVADVYHKAAQHISKHTGIKVEAHQVQAATWLVRQRLNAAEDNKMASIAELGRQAKTKWDEYAGEHHPLAMGKEPGTGYHHPGQPEDIDHADMLVSEGHHGDLALHTPVPRTNPRRKDRVNPVTRAAMRILGYGETMAPAEVDTLREEACPVCDEKDSYDGMECMVCGFLKPPDQFMDPDLDAAKRNDLRGDDDLEGKDVAGLNDDLNDRDGDGLDDETGLPVGAEEEGALDTQPTLGCPNCGETFEAAEPQSTNMRDPEQHPDGAAEGDVCPNCGTAELVSGPVADEEIEDQDDPDADDDGDGIPNGKDPDPEGDEEDEDEDEDDRKRRMRSGR